MNLNSQKVIDAMREVLAQYLPHGAHAVLYGSRARGDNREDSDWDVLIVLPDEEYSKTTKGIPSLKLWLRGLDFEQEINPLTYSSSMWENSSFSPFHQQVIKDQIPLFSQL